MSRNRASSKLPQCTHAKDVAKVAFVSSSGSSRIQIPHVAALDGLRGIALLGVLLFHANGALPGGYLGVDLFFVLSGFLITSLLLAEQRATGKIALSSFWVRRARRLFPALLSLIPAIAIYGRFFARPDELEALRAEAFATLAYAANWHAVLGHRSYWQLFATPSPLEHTWSLSIEEQFYLVWPLLVALVLRRGSKRSVTALAVALSAFSMSAMILLFTPEDTTRAYLGTDTRMAGILCGAALATFVSPGKPFPARTVRWLDVLGAIGALGLGIAWWSLEGDSPFLYRGGFWLSELAALALIGCAVSGNESFIARALSIRPLTWLGTISYGVYLWHWPVNVFLTPERAHLQGPALHAARFALTFGIALLSYRFLERPISRHGLPFGRPHYIVPAAVLLSIFLIVRATYARERTPDPPELQPVLAAARPSELVRYRVLIFGDSTANSLGWGLRGLHERGVVIDLRGKDGCTLFGDSCDVQHWAEQVKLLRPNVTLVYLAGAFLHGFSVNGNWRTACHPDWDSKFENALSRRLRELAVEKSRIFAITAPYPVGNWDTARYRAQIDCINAAVKRAAAAAEGVQVLDLEGWLCPGGVCQLETADDKIIRPDGVHFSLAGAQPLARWVFERIQH